MRQKRVALPVTALRHEFSLVLHAAFCAADHGHFGIAQYDKIGQAMNVIWGALELRPPKDLTVKTIIEGAMRAMNDAGRRAENGGIWELRTYERAALLAGIIKAEEILPKMDVFDLYKAMQLIKTIKPIPH